VQWLGVILGAVLLVAAVFYFLAGFFPRSGVGQRMRSRLELTADVRRARGYALNTPAIYAWLLRTKPRVAVLVLFLMFWGGWFIWAGVHTS
jgi:hypothetical protein